MVRKPRLGATRSGAFLLVHPALPEIIRDYVPYRGCISTPDLYELTNAHYGSLGLRTFYRHVRRLIKIGEIAIEYEAAPPMPRTYRRVKHPR